MTVTRLVWSLAIGHAIRAACRSAGEGSTATRSEDGNEADEGAGAAGCSALAAIKDSKEKNRQVRCVWGRAS